MMLLRDLGLKVPEIEKNVRDLLARVKTLEKSSQAHGETLGRHDDDISKRAAQVELEDAQRRLSDLEQQLRLLAGRLG